MATLSRPRSPRPLLNAAWAARNSGTGAGTGTGPAAVSDSTTATATFADKVGRSLPPQQQPQPQQAQPAQAQGRDVVNQGGQRGVMSDQGKFQELGDAALSKLAVPSTAMRSTGISLAPGIDGVMRQVGSGAGGGTATGTGTSSSAIAGPGQSPADVASYWTPERMMGAGPARGGSAADMVADIMPGQGAGTAVGPGAGPGAGTGAGDIESAISSLRSQLGMPAGSNAASSPATGIAGAIAGRMSGQGQGAQLTQPQQAQARNFMAQFGAGRPNPYAEILRQRMNPAAGGGLAGAGGGQLQRQYAY